MLQQKSDSTFAKLQFVDWTEREGTKALALTFKTSGLSGALHANLYYFVKV